MAKFPVLKAEKRTVSGRKVKKLRREGILPANVFGKKIKSISVQVNEKEFAKIFGEVGETGLIEVVVGEEKYHSLVTGFAKDPVSGKWLHADFHNVSLKEKVTAMIPVEVTGEAPAVKDLGGVLAQNTHEIEVEALPTDLPESIQVDVSGLVNIGDSVLVKDLKLSADIEVKVEPDVMIVTVNEAPKEEVVEEKSDETVEAETTEQGKPEEAAEEKKEE